MKRYYELAKPGIIYGNLVTALGGFFLASRTSFHLGLLLAMVLGLALVIGSACVFNNYTDRGIDATMKRTAKRALVSGTISGPHALVYGAILGVLGVLLLAFGTNLLTAVIALAGHLMYIGPYGYFKRRSVHGTLVGSLPGAVPPVVGYCAVTGQIDAAAAALFFILIFWQMPHFYAIAMYRLNDYIQADIPVLPAVRGMAETRRQILLYVLAFVLSISLLKVFGYAGYSFLTGAAGLGIAWLVIGLKKLPDELWGREMFRFSLIVITALSTLFAVGPHLP